MAGLLEQAEGRIESWSAFCWPPGPVYQSTVPKALEPCHSRKGTSLHKKLSVDLAYALKLLGDEALALDPMKLFAHDIPKMGIKSRGIKCIITRLLADAKTLVQSR